MTARTYMYAALILRVGARKNSESLAELTDG
jgi:hypothetical protein